MCRDKRGHPAVHPRTPNIFEDCSKRCFDGLVRDWRRKLHMWDDPEVRPDLLPAGTSLGKRRASKEDTPATSGLNGKIVDTSNSAAEASNKKIRRDDVATVPHLGHNPLSVQAKIDKGGEEELTTRKFVDTCGEGEEEPVPVDFDEQFDDDEDVL